MSSTRTSHLPPGTPDHSEQMEDKIDFPKVIAVGVISVLIFVGATWWAYVILKKETSRIQETGAPPVPAQITQEEIGIVDQVTFDKDVRLARWKEERAARLSSYGWADQARGRAYIPVERAMEELVAGAAAGKAGQAGEAPSANEPPANEPPAQTPPAKAPEGGSP